MAQVTKAFGIPGRTCQPTTCLVHTSLKSHKYAHVPLARGKYVLSLTHTRLAWVGRGWLLHRHRANGALAALPPRSGPAPLLDAVARAELVACLRQQPDATLDELRV